MKTKKAKGQIQEPSHKEIKVAVQIYLKNEGKLQRSEMCIRDSNNSVYNG